MIAAAIFALGPGTPRWLFFIAAILLVADAVFIVRYQLPLNQQITAWTEADIPPDWAQLRDRWARNHTMRLVLGVGAYLLVLVAIMLMLAA